MLLVKNRLIFGAIKTVFGAIFKTIYGILGLFSLQPLVFCAVAGALLEIAFRAVSGSDAGFILFHLILCLCVLYAVLRTVYRLLGLGRKKIKRRERAQILSDFEEREERDNVSPPARSPEPPREERPRYYRVKQNPKYVMAEFRDRFELYLETDGSLQYIRTDYKGV